MRQLKREYEKLANSRKDIANKIYHRLTTAYDVIYFQDEQIKGWQKGLFGKSVQSSCLGSLKQRLVALEASGRSFKISKWEPTTKLCPVCGTINHPTLADRIYKCSCGYTMDRDTHSARVILMIGSSKRAECLEQASAEGVVSMPACTGVAHANPLMRKQETHQSLGGR